jgi:hypothetical protein
MPELLASTTCGFPFFPKPPEFGPESSHFVSLGVSLCEERRDNVMLRHAGELTIKGVETFGEELCLFGKFPRPCSLMAKDFVQRHEL